MDRNIPHQTHNMKYSNEEWHKALLIKTYEKHLYTRCLIIFLNYIPSVQVHKVKISFNPF